MGTIKSKSKKHHTITNANDAIISVTGYIRFSIHEWSHKSSSNCSYKISLFHLLEPPHLPSITSYDSIPICIINLIIRFYYFNPNQDTNEMDDPPLTLSSLKVGDRIDAKDDWEKYYPATILFIKDQNSEFPQDHNISRLGVSPGIKYLYPNDWVQDLGLFIHYNGCSSRYDEWIFVKKHTICDCNDICHYKDLHFISKPNTQSKRTGVAQSPQFGNPPNIIRNAVGLANLGGTSWLNATLQCLYHTKPFKALIMNGAYWKDAYALAMEEETEAGGATTAHYKQSAKYYQQLKENNAFVLRLHDVFCNLNANEFGVVSPIHIHTAILNDKHPPIFAPGVAKPARFLQWMLESKLSKKDRIKQIFEGQYHSIKAPPESNKANLSKRSMRHWFTAKYNHNHKVQSTEDSFLSLPVPIMNGMQRDFTMDIYDARDLNPNHNYQRQHGLNPPMRHRVTLPRDGTVSDLQKVVGTMYHINSATDSVFFYRLWGFRCCYVWNSFEPLSDVDDEIACYIVHNWKSTNHICHIHHVRPIEKSEMDQMIGNEDENSANSSHIPHAHAPLHDNYYSSHDTDDEDETDMDDEESSESSDEPPHTQHHHHLISHMNDKHVIHPYAFGQPFIISMPNNRTSGRLIHKIIYQRLYLWLGEGILRSPPPIVMDEDDNELVDDAMENAWDVYLVNLPYTLRWVHKDYNFYFDAFKPPIVTADDVPINYTWNYHANIVIEWNQDTCAKVKTLLNQRECAANINANGSNDNPCVHDPDTMSIYDCLQTYFDEKQVELWSLPEILVLHLPRFYEFSVERVNKRSIRSGYIPSMVKYPVNGLDLNRFMAEQLTMNAHYDLYAVLCHSQTNHFYAFCKTKLTNDEDEWYKFEDSKITQVRTSSLVNNKALILFYQKTKQNTELANHALLNKYF